MATDVISRVLISIYPVCNNYGYHYKIIYLSYNISKDLNVNMHFYTNISMQLRKNQILHSDFMVMAHRPI